MQLLKSYKRYFFSRSRSYECMRECSCGNNRSTVVTNMKDAIKHNFHRRGCCSDHSGEKAAAEIA